MLDDRWFGASSPAAPGRRDLFCLPYAGGDATGYWDWQRSFPAPVRVVPVRLPGRDERAHEPLSVCPGDVAAAIGPRAAAGPYAIYGHSMGARVAFEVIRELRRAGVPLPVAFYAGCARPPHLAEPMAGLAAIDERDLVEQMIVRLNAPTELRTRPEVREMLMPLIRADLDWLRRYRFAPEPPLPVPVVAFAGTADPEISPETMLGWARHTSAGFRLHTLHGDHILLRAGGMPDLIAADLAARPADPRTAPPEPDEVHLWMAVGVPVDAVIDRVTARYEAEPHLASAVDHGVALVGAARDGATAVAVRRLRPARDPGEPPVGLTAAERAEVAAAPEESRLLTALRLAAVREVRAAAGRADGDVTVLEAPGAVVAVAGVRRVRFELLRGPDL